MSTLVKYAAMNESDRGRHTAEKHFAESKLRDEMSRDTKTKESSLIKDAQIWQGNGCFRETIRSFSSFFLSL